MLCSNKHNFMRMHGITIMANWSSWPSTPNASGEQDKKQDCTQVSCRLADNRVQ